MWDKQVIKRLVWMGVFGLLWWPTAVLAQDVDDEVPTEPLFVDVSTNAGISDNRIGTEKEIGIAWGDYDNDGWVDLIVTDHAGPNHLYRNLGDGRFELSSEQEVIAYPDLYSTGVSFIDYDNDGWRDIYLLNWGENILLRNVDGRFVDVTAEAGIGGGDKNSKTASWGDFDQDGDLDLYVANWACYPQCGRPSAGDSDRFYQNNGDGTFTDITHLLSSKISGAGFVASFTDYDNDQDLDIYLVNDEFINPVGNALWRNDGAGCDGWCFTEVGAEAQADTQLMGMGLATADYDNDGDLDFYFSNAGPMALLQNQGNGTFLEQAAVAGVQTPNTISWGTVFFDYDNDGWQDAYVAISDVASEDGTQNNDLFRNNGDGTFADVSVKSGADDIGSTLGVATADYNRDGRVDLLVGNIDTGYFLYENRSLGTDENHWFALDFFGGGPINLDGVGTRVWLTTADGQTQLQELIAGASLGAGNELVLHFGLGGHDQIAELRVLWPDGTEQIFNDVTADRRVTLPYPVDETAVARQLERLHVVTDELPAVSNAVTAPGLEFLIVILLIMMGIGLVFMWR